MLVHIRTFDYICTVNERWAICAAVRPVWTSASPVYREQYGTNPLYREHHTHTAINLLEQRTTRARIRQMPRLTIAALVLPIICRALRPPAPIRAKTRRRSTMITETERTMERDGFAVLETTLLTPHFK